MLTELRIRNFAIIESLTLPLSGGFNVLSGETGAGKSIIVGALGFLLGERGSSDLIRTGADKATVEGVFDIGDRKTIAELIDERGIEADEGTVVLKREIAANDAARPTSIGSSRISSGASKMAARSAPFSCAIRVWICWSCSRERTRARVGKRIASAGDSARRNRTRAGEPSRTARSADAARQ